MTRGAAKLVLPDEMTAGAGNLTDTAFWEDYWGRFSLPDTIDENRSFDRGLAAGLRRLLRGSKGEVLEIGCAPGRWLAFLSKEFNLGVSGIEYTADGATATRRNLELLGVKSADIREADFLTTTPSPKYDVVVSLGFVEHFTDVEAIIRRHGAWARPGGHVIIGVPNFKGVHGWLQRGLDPEVLAHHNLTIMDVDRLAELGPAAGLVTESVEYLGSLEPSLPIARAGVKGLPDFFAKVALRAMRLIRRAPVIGHAIDDWNNSFVSSYILASYRKPS
ncbi:MAG: class I SAM-dependent methyltransferase [Thermoanaerobaculia bacterium]